VLSLNLTRFVFELLGYPSCLISHIDLLHPFEGESELYADLCNENRRNCAIDIRGRVLKVLETVKVSSVC